MEELIDTRKRNPMQRTGIVINVITADIIVNATKYPVIILELVRIGD